MTLLSKSLIILTCTLGAVSLGGMAAAPAGTPSTTNAPAGWQNPPPSEPMPMFSPHPGGPMMMPMFFPHPGGPMMMPHGTGFCHGGEVFCASMQSDNPGETLQKLNSILPAATAGSHYEVRISVVKVPDHHDEEKAPDAGAGPHPANGG
ncbi:hypothetical protein [Sodalis sp. dw_96]|uniref:hypothetical protein n=1 Tax=Sodalis sp. dw_96 TaxID=2719794 RepID=UPI002103608F|nr:hypothetical protein [Sodalis sp. dw_96]